MKALLAAAALLAVTLSAQAEYLVYKGTLRHYSPQDAVGTTSRTCYLVINTSTKEAGFVASYLVKGKKKHTQSDVLATRGIPLDRIDGKQVATFSYAKFVDNGGGLFFNESLFLHGLRASVTINTGTTDQQPKTLTGNYSAEAIGLLARYEENSFALTFDQPHTIQAN